MTMARLLVLLTLVASLAGNVWLAAQWRAAEAESAPAPPRLIAPPAAAPPVVDSAPPESGRLPTTSAEFRTLQAQLEALHLPPEVVRAVIAMSIHRSFHQKRQQLVAPGADEYWRNRVMRDDAATQAALRDLNLEQRKMLRELNAEEIDFDGDGERRRFGDLPPEKIARLKKIFSDYSDLEEQLFTDPSERNSAEARARAELLAREKRADIERLLTPEELLAYDYRNSPAAHRLRGMFGQFQATEAEFVAAYPQIKAILDSTGEGTTGRMGAPSDLRRARAASAEQMEAALRQTLGDARYAELKEANDHLLQQTRQFAASVNLPPHAAAEVLAVQKEFAPKLTAVDRDRDLTANQRDAKASALALEARERLLRVLGPENFEAYKRRGGGWLGAALNRTPPSPSPRP